MYRSYEASLSWIVKGVVAGETHGDYGYGDSMCGPSPRCRCDATRHEFPVTGHPPSSSPTMLSTLTAAQ